MATSIESVFDEVQEPAVRGFLHRPPSPDSCAIVLAHGAGSNAQSPVLVAVANAFAEGGIGVLRIDLPYRQVRRTGPPFPGMAQRDREGIRRAAEVMREICHGDVFVGGHSYGGRQASMLISEDSSAANGLLLLSYPLHPPRKPEQRRDAHFSKIQVPALFVSGSRDPFGSPDEIRQALNLIPARTELVIREGAGHDLGKGTTLRDLAEMVVKRFEVFMSPVSRRKNFERW